MNRSENIINTNMSYYTDFIKKRAVVSESPDLFVPNKEGDGEHWGGSRKICFIFDKEGNGVICKGTTHSKLQRLLWITSEDNEEEVMEVYTAQQLLYFLSLLDNVFYIKDGKSLAKEIEFNESKDDFETKSVRYRLGEYCVGRVFPEHFGVSFWNSNNSLNDTQRYAIFDMLTKLGHDPKKFIYETGPLEIQMSYDKFKDGGTVESKKDKDPIMDLSKELHTMVDPKVKKMVRNELQRGKKPYKPKKHIPWEWKSLIRQENTNNMESFKYYAFDWDDNLLYMPTKVIGEDSHGNELELSTGEYSLVKESVMIGKPSVVGGRILKSFPENAFNNFRRDDLFLNEAREAKLGPAWSDFVEAVNGGRIFSIITARGHSPNTFKSTIKTLIKEGKGGLNYYTCLDSLKSLREYSQSSNIRTDEELFENYIDNLCRYYPISHNVSTDIVLEHVHECKRDALGDFITHVNRVFEAFHPEFHNNVSNKFIIGFSDDDRTNIKTISESTFETSLEIYSTHNGIMERV
jgi:hypothetical protein